MDTDTDQTSETTESTASEVTTSAPETMEASSEATETPSQEENEVTPEVPAYTPNYKLKVYDEEKELDDPFLKDLIKDQKSEEKVKEIAQKYLGFDTVKGRHEKLKGEYTQYQQQVQPVVEYYNKAATFMQKGNLEGLFDLLQIPSDAIFRYAVKKAEEAQLGPEQQAQLQQQRQMAKQKEYLESQNQTLMTQQQQQISQFRAQELSWTLQRPDVASVAKAFDDRVGRPGAFRQAIIDKGLAHYAATNGREDLSAEQATAEVMKLIGPVVTQTTMTAQQAQPLIQQPNGQPPIIPNVTGRGASPVRKQMRSLADLKKKREEILRDSS